MDVQRGKRTRHRVEIIRDHPDKETTLIHVLISPTGDRSFNCPNGRDVRNLPFAPNQASLRDAIFSLPAFQALRTWLLSFCPYGTGPPLAHFQALPTWLLSFCPYGTGLPLAHFQVLRTWPPPLRYGAPSLLVSTHHKAWPRRRPCAVGLLSSYPRPQRFA